MTLANDVSKNSCIILSLSKDQFRLPLFPRSQTPFGNALAEATPLPISAGGASGGNRIAPTMAFPNGVWNEETPLQKATPHERALLLAVFGRDDRLRALPSSSTATPLRAPSASPSPSSSWRAFRHAQRLLPRRRPNPRHRRRGHGPLSLHHHAPRPRRDGTHPPPENLDGLHPRPRARLSPDRREGPRRHANGIGDLASLKPDPIKNGIFRCKTVLMFTAFRNPSQPSRQLMCNPTTRTKSASSSSPPT